MQGFRRRVVYLTLYEGIAITMTSLAFTFLFNVHAAEAGTISVIASVIAVVWNLAYNMMFEAWEARRATNGRGVALRVVHALGFEGGLVLMLVPMMAFLLGISLVEAFMLDLGLIVFFLVYTFLFNLAFDQVFGLPASAMIEA